MEGRTELQKVIMHYEKQRAEAIRAKQEAEIVLPFVRAALEELDTATGQAESADSGVMDRVQSQVNSARAAQGPAIVQPEPAADNAFEDQVAPFEDAIGDTGRASIASLIEEANGQKAS